MMRRVRLIAGIVIAVAILIQLVPVDRGNPPEGGALTGPAAVVAILHRACFDCHSDRTTWPWYSHVAPVSWLVAGDVREARHLMNFSNWETYTPNQRQGFAGKIGHQVETNQMPIPRYRMIHRAARLSAADRATLRAWTDSLSGGAP